MARSDDERRRYGAWYTPAPLVRHVVESTLPPHYRRRTVVSVLDPACGDGRFLAAAAQAITARGGVPVLTGVDIDPAAITAARRYPELRDAELICVDTLSAPATAGLLERRWDVVLGNPPFLSPLSADVRADAAGRGAPIAGGQYADAAVQFLALAVRVARDNGGRVGLVLPLSVLGSRDARPVREEVDEVADIRWLWWSPEPVFDAAVVTCAIGLERRGRRGDVPREPVVRTIGPDFRPLTPSEPPPIDVGAGNGWAVLVAEDLGIPPVPADLHTDGTVGDRARATADFRDQYYGLTGAVVDDLLAGALNTATVPLVTTGLIDPGVCRWGTMPVRYLKSRFTAPAVTVDRLTPELQEWVHARRVPKVLVATQTAVLEAVVDPDGTWLPAVPVISVVPLADDGPSVTPALWEVAAVLTSPVASASVARRAAGTGLSARVVRVTARLVAEVPWPAGDLAPAVEALTRGDIIGCGEAVTAAYGLDALDAEHLLAWWQPLVLR